MKVLSSMPWPTKLPNIPQSDLNAHRLARNAVEFPSDRPASVPWEGVNAETALLIITSSVCIQEATGLDNHGLLRRLSTKWTPDSALMDCKLAAPSLGRDLTPSLNSSGTIIWVREHGPGRRNLASSQDLASSDAHRKHFDAKFGPVGKRCWCHRPQGGS